MELDFDDMQLLCARDDSKVYKDGDKYIITKEKKGQVLSTTDYLVKDWELCPWDCHKKFGYKIVDMEYMSDLYDRLVLGKKQETVDEIVARNKAISAEKRAGEKAAKKKQKS